MKTLVIYDSQYGNTEKVAQAITAELSSTQDVTIVRAGEAESKELTGIELLIAGAPTQRFRPTPAMNNFLNGIPKGGLNGVKVAAFDTRFKLEDIDNRVLLFFVKIFGYAAESISKQLQSKGGIQVIDPQGLGVLDIEGPLKDGEMERATSWAKEINIICSKV